MNDVNKSPLEIAESLSIDQCHNRDFFFGLPGPVALEVQALYPDDPVIVSYMNKIRGGIKGGRNQSIQGDVFGRLENEPRRKKDPPPLELHTAVELMGMDLKPPDFIIKDLVPVGVSMLSAASKIGKSWMALDMALSVVSGKPFMGFDTNKCEVVYFALEDSWFRLKSRLKKLTGYDQAPAGLTMAIRSENVQNGFMGQLEALLDGNTAVRLVIIDTFQKIRPPSDRNKTAYEQDYQLLGEFGKLSLKHNANILFLHHTRKGNGFEGDPFGEILGSTALQGATDVMFVIKKQKRTDENAIFYAAGRDIEQHELCLRFDKNTCRWINEGDTSTLEKMRLELEYRNNSIVKAIKYQLERIESDESEPIKEYVARIRDIRSDTLIISGELIGTSERNFASEMKKWLLHLQSNDKIRCIEPTDNTTHKNIKGRWYRFKRMP